MTLHYNTVQYNTVPYIHKCIHTYIHTYIHERRAVQHNLVQSKSASPTHAMCAVAHPTHAMYAAAHSAILDNIGR